MFCLVPHDSARPADGNLDRDADELAAILAGPLPALPPGRVRAVAAELREMATPAAQSVWRHDGWGALVGWTTRRVPECDPIVPAIQAIRRSSIVQHQPAAAPSVAECVLASARRSPADRDRVHVRLVWEPLDECDPAPLASESVGDEALELLRQAEIAPSSAAWAIISPAIDIAVDWWADFASRTGLVGDDLVTAARTAEHLPSKHRLRGFLAGPAGRPLVALLLGGDQWGRTAREESGREASLLLWALDVRRARLEGRSAPVPPAPVVRAWSRTIAVIEAEIRGQGNVCGEDSRRDAA